MALGHRQLKCGVWACVYSFCQHVLSCTYVLWCTHECLFSVAGLSVWVRVSVCLCYGGHQNAGCTCPCDSAVVDI